MPELNNLQLKNLINYLSKHIALVTLAVALIGTGAGVLGKSLQYVYMLGKYNYFSIDPVNIDVSNDNILYYLLFLSAIVVFLFLINYYAYKTLTGSHVFLKKLKIMVNLILVLTIITILIMLFIIYGFIDTVKNFLGIITIEHRGLIFIAIIVSCVVCGPAIVFTISKSVLKKNKIKNQDLLYSHEMKKLKILIPTILRTFVLLTSIYFIMFLGLGFYDAYILTNFKIVENKEAVIFENDSKYILVPCEIKENGDILNLEVKTQREVKKDEIITQNRRFERVERNLG